MTSVQKSDNFNLRVGLCAVDRYGIGQRNERRKTLLQFYAINQPLVIPSKPISQKEESHGHHQMEKHNIQMDYIIVNGKWKCFLKNSRTYNSTSIGSDHSLVMVIFLVLFQRKKRIRMARTAYRYDTDKIIHDKEVCLQFEMRIHEAFKPLLLTDDKEASTEDVYNKFKNATNRKYPARCGRGKWPEVIEWGDKANYGMHVK